MNPNYGHFQLKFIDIKESQNCEITNATRTDRLTIMAHTLIYLFVSIFFIGRKHNLELSIVFAQCSYLKMQVIVWKPIPRVPDAASKDVKPKCGFYSRLRNEEKRNWGNFKMGNNTGPVDN